MQTSPKIETPEILRISRHTQHPRKGDQLMHQRYIKSACSRQNDSSVSSDAMSKSAGGQPDETVW